MKKCSPFQANWDPDRIDKAACQHEEAVAYALRIPGIARRAALHAQAMLYALEGNELVIPPPPGVYLSCVAGFSPVPQHPKDCSHIRLGLKHACQFFASL